MHRFRTTIFTILLMASFWGLALAINEEPDFVTSMNVGKAYLENRNSKEAIKAFDAALKLNPESAAALRNRARAHLLAQKPERALQDLELSAGFDPNSIAGNYLRGIALARLARFADAIPYLEMAVRLDPNPPALPFQLANAYQNTEQHQKSVEQLHETLRRDPLHVSAHYRLSGYARKAGDREEFQRRMREFVRLRKLFGDETRSTAALERCAYTLAEPSAIEPDTPAEPVTPAIEVRFVDATDRVFASDADLQASAATVLETDESGRYTLTTIDQQGRLSLLRMSSGRRFERTETDYQFPTPAQYRWCTPGVFFELRPTDKDFDPKVHILKNLFAIGPAGAKLLRRTDADSFKDITAEAGLDGISGHRARWIDYDHDGDLDLFVARDEGLQLWQNNGDGTFLNVTESVGISPTGPVVDVLGVDLDSNIAVDLIVARSNEPTLVFENQRAGRYALMTNPPGPWPAARRILANDLNNDGHPDTVLIGEKHATIVMGKSANRPRIEFDDVQAASGVLIDFDNDGWLDLCIVGTTAADKGAIRLWRNLRDGKWQDVTGETALAAIDLPALRDVLAADLDNDGDTDLLLTTTNNRLRFLRNDGGDANRQLKVRLVPIKTNASGYGTHIEWRKGPTRVTRTVTELPIEIGVGSATSLDSLQTVWTNGVVDNQIHFRVPTKPVTITEKNVATGSCPFLYAWNGRTFRFVTDFLGNAPLGLSLRRDVILPADPDEFVVIGRADSFPPRDGFYELEITDEFREVLYLDQVKLVAVDHTPAVEIHSTDKLMPDPFPPSQLWALAAPKPLIRAVGDDGIDRTVDLQSIDGHFAQPAPLLPSPYRGMCYPLALTLDFGPLDPDRPLVLALTGWIQYGQASTNIAISQNSKLRIIPPTLEVETAPGVWTQLDVVVGMPAGKTKTILCDLTGKLPSEARRLRLSNTFEIRWDRIALFERATLEIRVTERAPNEAKLRWRGFSEIKSRAPRHPTTPDYETVFERPPWRTSLQGWCTRYGDVLELVTERDDRLALINAGDAMRLRFDAGAFPPVPDGMVRTFFFYSVGWDKDADHNCVDGDTVEPLPVPEPDGFDLPDPDDWRLRYNTRWTAFDRFATER